MNRLWRVLCLATVTGLVSIVGGGCTSDAYYRLADTTALIEGMPFQAKALRNKPLKDVLNGPPSWWQYEIAQRFEKGYGGLARNTTCAIYWYNQAAETENEFYQQDPTNPYKGDMRTRKGTPQARHRLRHYLDTGVSLDATQAAARESDLCEGLLNAAASQAKARA